jgi:hypothetical protein
MLPVALRARQEGRPWPAPPQGWAAEFRRRMTRVDAQLAGVSLVLCDDKATCFGAPDVLQVGGLSHATAQHDQPAKQALWSTAGLGLATAIACLGTACSVAMFAN